MIDSLIFSVGGVSGLAFIGCLRALEECGELDHVKTIVGCSAGSIIGCLIVLGYTAAEIETIADQIDFKNLFELNLDNIVSVDKDLGIDKGERLFHLIELFIKHKTGNEKTTFAELYSLKQIELSVGAVCLDTNSLDFFSYKTSPDMPLSIALRMSSAIPIMFTPIQWEGKLYVDGGTMGRYPVHAPCLEDIQCGMGFYIEQMNETIFKTSENCSFVEYISHILTLVYSSSQKYTPTPNITTVLIQTEMNGVEFDIGKEEKDKLINLGYESTKQKIIDLRLTQYNRILSAQKRIDLCVKHKKILGPLVFPK